MLFSQPQLHRTLAWPESPLLETLFRMLVASLKPLLQYRLSSSLLFVPVYPSWVLLAVARVLLLMALIQVLALALALDLALDGEVLSSRQSCLVRPSSVSS